MKQLLVTLKNSNDILHSFKDALKKAPQSHPGETHYEISFDSKKDFYKFARNIDLLSYILQFKPKSVYELSKVCHRDVSNINKIIRFFEELGIIKIKKLKISGRMVSRPMVDYESIQFKLVA